MSELASARPQRNIAFAATLTWAMVAATLHSYAVGPLAPFWREDLLFGAFEVGLVATAVGGVAAVGSVGAGAIVDQFGGRRLLVLLFLVSGAGLVVMGLAPGLVIILVGAGLGGVSQAVANPATNQLIGTTIPASRRGAYIGVKLSGVQASAVLVGASFPVGAILLGWRSVLVIAGLVVVVLGLLTVRQFVPVGGPTLGNDPISRSTQAVRSRLKGSRLLPLSGFLMGMGIAAVLTYVPLYVVDAGGSAVTGGAALAVIGFVGVVARIYWAHRAARTGAAGWILSLLGACAAVSALLLLAFPWLGWGALWVAAVLNGASAAAWNAPASVALVRANPHSIGRSTGEVYLGFLGGLVVTPIALGFAIDAAGNYYLTWAVAAMAFAGSGWAGWRWGRAIEGDLADGAVAAG